MFSLFLFTLMSMIFLSGVAFVILAIVESVFP